jgi:lipopolysaccharide biosynthesis glycosyltransferase
VPGIMKPLDIVVKTRKKDLVTYLQLQEDLTRHRRLKGKVHVIVPDRDVALFKSVIHESYQLSSSEEVVGLAGYCQVFPDTWITQQIVKLLAANLVADDQYLVLDSNTLIGFDFDESFFATPHGDYVYAVGEFRDSAWELQSRNFLKLRRPGRIQGFRAVNQIFIKANVQRLIHQLESLYQDNVVATLLRFSDEFATEFWTEYALYGVFIQNFPGATGHAFEKRGDVLHFSHKDDFAQFICRVEEAKPLMIKLYKRRPNHELTTSEYKRCVKKVKATYLRAEER